MPPSLLVVYQRQDVEISEDRVTRPNERVFKYHNQMHQYPEKLVHYLGLEDRMSLHHLRMSQPTLYFWANCFRPWIYSVMIDIGDPTSPQSPWHDICLVFRLFRERNQTIDQFEDSFGLVSLTEFKRQLCEGFDNQPSLVPAPDSVPNEAKRAWSLAYCLIAFKRLLEDIASGDVRITDLDSVVEMWKYTHRLEISQTPEYDNFAVIPILYIKDNQVRIVAPDYYQEDPFEQYQRLFILLKHIDDQLRPFMWRMYTYDFVEMTFRYPDHLYSLDPSEEIRHAPHWMQRQLAVDHSEEQNHALEQSLRQSLQKSPRQSPRPKLWRRHKSDPKP